MQQKNMLLFFSFFFFQNQIEKIENLDCFPNLRYGQLLPPGRSLSWSEEHSAPFFPWQSQGNLSCSP